MHLLDSHNLRQKNPHWKTLTQKIHPGSNTVTEIKCKPQVKGKENPFIVGGSSWVFPR